MRLFLILFKIKKLNIARTSISESGGLSIAENLTLWELNLSYNNYGGIVSSAVAKISVLEKLVMISFQISDIGVHKLALNQSIKSLNISQNFDITVTGLAMLSGNIILKHLFYREFISGRKAKEEETPLEEKDPQKRYTNALKAY